MYLNRFLILAVCFVNTYAEDVTVFEKVLPKGIGELFELREVRKDGIYRDQSVEVVKKKLLRNETISYYHSCSMIVNGDGVPTGAVWVTRHPLPLKNIFEYDYSDSYKSQFHWAVRNDYEMYYTTPDIELDKAICLNKDDLWKTDVIKGINLSGDNFGKYLLQNTIRANYVWTESELDQWTECQESLVDSINGLTSLKIFDKSSVLSETLPKDDCFPPRGIHLEGPRVRVNCTVKFNRNGYEDFMKKDSVSAYIYDFSFSDTMIARHELFRTLVEYGKRVEMVEHPKVGWIVKVAPREKSGELGSVRFLLGSAVFCIYDKGYGVDAFLDTIKTKSSLSESDIEFFNLWKQNELQIQGDCLMRLLKLPDEWVRDSFYISPVRAILRLDKNLDININQFKDVSVQERRSLIEGLLRVSGYVAKDV